MSEQIFQKRTYELEEFIPTQFGDPEWIDPATIWIPVDKLGWAEAMKMSLVQFIANLHKEQGPVLINGVDVVVEFDTDFSNTDYYLDIKPIRIHIIEGIKYVEIIAVKNLIKLTNGFTLTLESYQAGDSFNYLAFE